MAEKKKKKFSLREFLSKIHDLVAGRISLQAVGILIIILFFIFTITNRVTRIETQLEPLVKADLPIAIAKIDMLFNFVIVENIIYQIKENTIKHLNPEINDGLNVFLEKMQEEEFTKINNSSQSDGQKVIEIIVKIGGIEKLIDLLETKDHSLAYGVVFLFVENYDFSKN